MAISIVQENQQDFKLVFAVVQNPPERLHLRNFSKTLRCDGGRCALWCFALSTPRHFLEKEKLTVEQVHRVYQETFEKSIDLYTGTGILTGHFQSC